MFMHLRGGGTSIVPWGTPDGRSPHSEKKPQESFTHWFLSMRKLINKRETPGGNGEIGPSWWECNDRLGRTSFYCAAEHSYCSAVCMERRVCSQEDLGMALNWSWLTISKMAEATTAWMFSATFDREGMSEIGLICFEATVIGFNFGRGVTSA